MMLPGVELARRRCFHNRNDVPFRGPQEPSCTAQPQRIDEPAAEAARRRLEEKLRRPISGSSSPSSSPSPAYHFPRALERNRERLDAHRYNLWGRERRSEGDRPPLSKLSLFLAAMRSTALWAWTAFCFRLGS